ncbi:hypothetical protein BS47DRAFT_96790 [Hydnum rufescens UP504]|uniref:Aminoglycoside phosphotransferase domain-containing protein n=1 Tax=Hydnum rufescens UP504 TaxID=1448309 RepID=A0A9P6AQM4_9AGAM|nr:hypothetical protein BS47DRAFT_96790 [Hydnum rufescens UP504]
MTRGGGILEKFAGLRHWWGVPNTRYHLLIRMRPSLERHLDPFRTALSTRSGTWYADGVLKMNDHILVKFGTHVRKTEACTMEYVSRHTTIPVPRIIDVISQVNSNGSTVVYIMMEHIDATRLDVVWPSLSADVRTAIALELKGYIDQLRMLKAPYPGRVESVDGTGWQDERIESRPNKTASCTIPEFHRYMGVHQAPIDPSTYSLFMSRSQYHQSTFTHGDLGMHNILVRDGRIAAVLDWEWSGWRPEGYEYSRAYLSNLTSLEWWRTLSAVLDIYDVELKVYTAVAAYFG